MRGKLCAVRVELGLTGITPAGAGKTSFSYHVMRRSRDHPRRCGENSLLPSVRRCKSGSPPQVRGKQCRLTNRRPRSIITPAGAGKTMVHAPRQRQHLDHPRRCGENLDNFLLGDISRGSPPQVRGKPNTRNTARKARGITPAGAGKTLVHVNIKLHSQDHPRRCGENVTVYALLATGDGSPPQVRGKPRQRRDIFPRKRITPAGAGKTRYTRRRDRNRQDHPRRCGENGFT